MREFMYIRRNLIPRRSFVVGLCCYAVIFEVIPLQDLKVMEDLLDCYVGVRLKELKRKKYIISYIV